MELYWTPYLIPLFISASIVLVLLVHSLRNRQESAAVVFSLTMLALLIWQVAYCFELASLTLSTKLFWANIQFLGIASAPVLWFIMTLRLIGLPPIRGSVMALLWIIPLVTNILAWTDPFHHLFRIHPDIDIRPWIILVEADYGVWHNVVFVTFQYIMYGVSLVLFIDARLKAKNIYRYRYTLLMVAMLLPLSGSLFYVFAVPPFDNLNPTAVLFSFTGLFFGYAIFRYRMLDILPLARDSIIEELRDGVIVVDDKNRILDFNEAAKTILDMLTPDGIGKSIEESLTDVPQLVEQVLSTDQQDKELQISLGNDHRHFNSRISPIYNKYRHPMGKAIILTDVTERAHLIDELKTLASLDDLTKLYNRRYFFSLGEAEIERSRRNGRACSLILMDLDRFKYINDNFGHIVGDRVLRHVADWSRKQLRKFDIMGRYGGEEFVIFLPETTVEGGQIVAERIRETLDNNPVDTGEHTIPVTSSFGVAGFSAQSEGTLEELLRDADYALFQAKEQGRNRTVVHT